jgi:hypothetical protein
VGNIGPDCALAEWERWWTEMIGARSMKDKKGKKLFNRVECRDFLSNFHNRFVADEDVGAPIYGKGDSFVESKVIEWAYETWSVEMPRSNIR